MLNSIQLVLISFAALDLKSRYCNIPFSSCMIIQWKKCIRWLFKFIMRLIIGQWFKQIFHCFCKRLYFCTPESMHNTPDYDTWLLWQFNRLSNIQVCYLLIRSLTLTKFEIWDVFLFSYTNVSPSQSEWGNFNCS